MANFINPIQFFRILLSIFLLSASYLVITLNLGTAPALFWMLTACFFIFITFEFFQSKGLFFSLPPAYFSVFMLLYIFISGLLYYSMSRQDITEFLVNDYYILMGAWYTLVSIQTLWISFYLLPSKPYSFYSSLSIKTIPIWVINILVVIFITSFFIGINNDMFGYVADTEKNNYLGLVRQGVSCGLIAIIALTIYHYNSTKTKTYLYSLIAANMFVGLMFGSKSTIVTPILVFLLTNYLMGRKISMKWYLGVVGTIIFAYIAVEPFRIYFDTIGASGTEFTVSSLISFFLTARAATEGIETDYFEAFIVRMNYATMLARTIEFANESQIYLTEQWQHLAMSPLYGLIPRFIWEGKPLADFGLWAAVEIFNLHPDTTTHIGVTPQGFAYLVYRLPGIIICFLLYGVISRIAYNSFYLVKNLLPIYIYFYFFILYPSYPTWTAVSSYIQALIVFIPVLLLAAFFRQIRIKPLPVKE